MRTGGSFAYGAIVARPQKPATEECTAMFIFVRPPGLEPGSFGYKPRALTFELWAQVRSKMRILHIFIFSERRVPYVYMGAYAAHEDT